MGRLFIIIIWSPLCWLFEGRALFLLYLFREVLGELLWGWEQSHQPPLVPVPRDTPLPPHGDGDGPGAVHGRVLTGWGRGAFREAGTGKNGSFSTPSARLPPEQHGSFHRLPNPANPPHNTLKVASGLHAGRHGEAAGGRASVSPPSASGPPSRAVGWCWGCGVVLAPMGVPMRV